MPGLDYLNSSYDPRDEAYSNSIIMPLAIEMGAIEGTRWGLNKYGKKMALGAAKRTIRENLSDFSRLPENGRALFAYKKSLSQTTTASKTLKGLSSKFLFSGMMFAGYGLAKGLIGSSRAFGMGTEEYDNSRYRNVYNGGDEYFDSRAAMTQRQRALQVIHNSQLSTRASMGSEANYLHY